MVDLKILMTFFWKHEKLEIGLWSWFLFLLLMLCIAALVWKYSWLFTMKFINENMYSHGRATISALLNRLLHDFSGLTPAINKTIFFCKVSIFLLLVETPPPQIIPYFIIEWK
jgi:hypothetical protein